MKPLRLVLALPLGFFACVAGDDSVLPGNDAGADATSDATTNDAALTDAPIDADAGPWTPAVLDEDGSLALWLESSSQNLTISSGQVEKWSDLSKNHNDATNPTAGPTVDSAVLNGHDAVSFATDVVLGITDAASLQFGTDQFFMIAVAKDTGIGGIYFFSKAQTKFSIEGQAFYQGLEFLAVQTTYDGGSGTLPYAHFAEDTTDSGTSVDYAGSYDAPVFDDGNFHIVGFRRNDPFDITIYADGKTQAATTGSFDVSQVGYGVNVGAVRYGQVIRQVTADVAEIIVVHSSIVSDATVANLQTYLKTKYAL